MKKSVLLVLFLIIITLSNAQSLSPDTSIYTSDFERELFDDIRDSTHIAPIRYFTAIDYDEADYRQLQTQISTIEKSLLNMANVKSKPIKKQVKLIYKKVHSEMLKKYSEDAFFMDIANNGVYNCVTASAVYAIILNDFNIDYTVMQRPNHVYLIVNPNKDDIIMESTNPHNGVLIIDEKAKRDFVKYLRSAKLISEQEYEDKSVDELFKQYFNDDKSINIKQLAGLQYYNKGVELFAKELYEKANPYFEKGLILYPESKLLRYYYNSSLSLTIGKQFSKDIYQGRMLGKYIHLNAASSESLDLAKNSFGKVTEHLTMQHPDIKAYTFYYNSMLAEIPDSVDLSKFNSMYHFYKAYYYYVNQDNDLSMEEVSRAYEVNNEDIRTRQLIHDNSIRLIVNENNYQETVDTFDYYLERYPFLLNDKDLQNIYVLFHYGAIVEAYNDGNDKLAASNWERTQQMFEKYDSLYFEKEFIEDFYSDTYYHYNARYKKTLAKKYLAEGRRMFPESEKLKNLEHQSNYKPRSTYLAETSTVVTPKAPEDRVVEFQDNFKKSFKGCWKAVSSYKVGEEEKKKAVKSTYKVQVVKSKNIKFFKDDKMQAGKWSLRPKSKLLYLIPDMNKSDYDLYKVVLITETEMHLRMYKDRKKTNTILIFKKCN